MGYGCTSSAATACSTAQFAIFADGSCDPVTFAAGYYQSGKTSYYRAATVGYYYDSGSASLETVCAKDNYCIYGTSTSCPSGLATEFMSPTTGEPYCISCPYGSACYLTGTIETKPCLNNTRYSLSMNTDCFQCDVDHDCVYRAQYFEFRNNVADNLQCPPDQYANYFDMTCSYIKRIGKNCPYGYRRMINDADTALHWAEQRVNCTENSYYTAGTYIHLPTGAQDCVAGTTKEATTERCSVSQPGYIAPGLNEADYDTSYKCPQGYFCGVSEDFLVGVLSQRTSRCPPGTYAQTSHAGGISDSETCLACPSGMYCSGNSIATPCDTGYICDFGTLNETMTCPTGFYYSTSATGTTMYERCVQCEAGYVCGAMATTATKQACPTGYYCGVQSSTAGSYSARPGFYIGTSGATTETSCEAGKYCPQGATSGTDCPVSLTLSSV